MCVANNEVADRIVFKTHTDRMLEIITDAHERTKQALVLMADVSKNLVKAMELYKEIKNEGKELYT